MVYPSCRHHPCITCAGGTRVVRVSGGIEYAEQTLGVHSVFQEAHDLVSKIDEVRKAIAAGRKNKRIYEADLVDREFELLSAAKAGDPSASQAAIERAVKSLVHTDRDARQIRQHQADLSASLDDLDAQLHTLERDLQVKVARMNELGGYFAYLAALKNAQTQGRTEWPSSTS